MQANVINYRPTQDTLDQIVLEALPILKVLGFEVEGELVLDPQTIFSVNLEQFVQKFPIIPLDPHILWK